MEDEVIVSVPDELEETSVEESESSAEVVSDESEPETA